MYVSLDMFTLLFLGVLINVLIHLFFRRASVLPAERREDGFNNCIAHVEPDLEKTANRYHNHPRIFLPRLLVRWPWPRQVNPHCNVVVKESGAWMASFSAFSPKVKDAYDRSRFALVACLFYPTLSKEHVRSGCNLMQALLVFDEYSDRSTPSEVRDQKDIILDALRNPYVPRPKEEWVGGEAIRQFWELAARDATELMKKRFIQSMDEYLEAVVQESINKRDHRILDVKSYTKLRRSTVAAKVTFMMLELEIDIPDEVMEHSTIQEMILIAVDIIFFCNDVLSFNREQMRGDHHHNLITCVMNEYNTDVNGAMLWTEDHVSQLCERYLAGMESLPHWEEPLNSHVRDYCDGMAHVVRGNYEWSFETERYFGDKNHEIQKNRWMSLLPKKGEREIGTIAIDGSLL